jgi:hypothetical protein
LIGGIAINTFCERRKSFAHSATGAYTHLRGEDILRAVSQQRQRSVLPLLSRDISSCHTVNNTAYRAHPCIHQSQLGLIIPSKRRLTYWGTAF